MRRYGRVYIAPSRIHGEGVFAAVDIDEGERIFAIDDSNVMPKGASLEVVERERRHHTDYLAAGKVVLLKAPEGCVNHSCDPNAYEKTIEGSRYGIALRDIGVGEEIGYDSRINGYGDTVWECNCGTARCLRTLHSNFFRPPR